MLGSIPPGIERPMYLILGTYQGRTETLDTTGILSVAEYLCTEYQMAYGPAWHVTIVSCDVDPRD